MPNHTQNIVSIETNTNVQEEILALQELKTDLKIKEGKFDFNGIIPMPQDIKKGDNWYDFSRLHWGTKWNAYEVEILQDEDWSLFVSFLTAWDSPRGIVEKIKAYCNQHHLHLDWTAEHEGEDGIEQIA